MGFGLERLQQGTGPCTIGDGDLQFDAAYHVGPQQASHALIGGHGTNSSGLQGEPLRFGIGYGLSTETTPIGEHSCYWGGWGGSFIVSDFDAHLTFAYVMNRMEAGLVGDTRGGGLLEATRQGLAG